LTSFLRFFIETARQLPTTAVVFNGNEMQSQSVCNAHSVLATKYFHILICILYI